jgi:hypothetical protein
MDFPFDPFQNPKKTLIYVSFYLGGLLLVTGTGIVVNNVQSRETALAQVIAQAGKDGISPRVYSLMQPIATGQLSSNAQKQPSAALVYLLEISRLALENKYFLALEMTRPLEERRLIVAESKRQNNARYKYNSETSWYVLGLTFGVASSIGGICMIPMSYLLPKMYPYAFKS